MRTPPKKVTAYSKQMHEYAESFKKKLPLEQQAIIDAFVYAELIRLRDVNTKDLCAKMRGSALTLAHKAPILTAHMTIIADQMDKSR